MIWYFTVLFLVFIANLYSIILSINIKERLFRLTTLILLSLCIFRYCTLYVFSVAQTPVNLYIIKNLVFTATISIPIVTYICIMKFNKGIFNIFDKIFTLILLIIGLVIMYNAPMGIINTNLGYKVLLSDEWKFIIMVIQGGFSVLMICISLNYFIKEKNIERKTVNFFFLIGYITAMAEGVLSILNKGILPEPIISEGIIFISIIMSMKINQKRI